MTLYQLYMRVKHFVVARYYHGHGIHSPSLYQVVRQVFMRYSEDDLEEGLKALFPEAVIIEIVGVKRIDTQADVLIIHQPFSSRVEYCIWKKWRSENSCRSVWLKSTLVIFRDQQFANQHFDIRT